MKNTQTRKRETWKNIYRDEKNKRRRKELDTQREKSWRQKKIQTTVVKILRGGGERHR
jgi:hypothetical protein